MKTARISRKSGRETTNNFWEHSPRARQVNSEKREERLLLFNDVVVKLFPPVFELAGKAVKLHNNARGSGAVVENTTRPAEKRSWHCAEKGEKTI